MQGQSTPAQPTGLTANSSERRRWRPRTAETSIFCVFSSRGRRVDWPVQKESPKTGIVLSRTLLQYQGRE
ncbi:hypothetical protein VTI28DRAFT_4728 [Corynascus sepedonium]